MVSLFGKVGFITKVGSRYNLRSREMVGGHPLTEKKSSKTFAYENFICAIVSTHLGKFRRKVQLKGKPYCKVFICAHLTEVLSVKVLLSSTR